MIRIPMSDQSIANVGKLKLKPCARCSSVLKAKQYEFDHTIPEALVVDKSRDLTADDGQLLGPCCHRGEGGKTAVDVGVIAKAKRIERKRLGLGIRGGRGFQTKLRKKMNGEVVAR